MHKRMFKVISAIEKKGGGKFWMRLGSAFINKDESINVYLDAVPKTLEFQLREMTEEDFARSSKPATFGDRPVPAAADPSQPPF